MEKGRISPSTYFLGLLMRTDFSFEEWLLKFIYRKRPLSAPPYIQYSFHNRVVNWEEPLEVFFNTLFLAMILSMFCNMETKEFPGLLNNSMGLLQLKLSYLLNFTFYNGIMLGIHLGWRKPFLDKATQILHKSAFYHRQSRRLLWASSGGQRSPSTILVCNVALP